MVEAVPVRLAVTVPQVRTFFAVSLYQGRLTDSQHLAAGGGEADGPGDANRLRLVVGDHVALSPESRVTDTLLVPAGGVQAVAVHATQEEELLCDFIAAALPDGRRRTRTWP